MKTQTTMNNHNLVHNYFFSNKENLFNQNNIFSENKSFNPNNKNFKSEKCFKCEIISNFRFKIKGKNYFLCYFHYKQWVAVKADYYHKAVEHFLNLDK